jgi:uncharacterized protein (TIGR02444 family)
MSTPKPLDTPLWTFSLTVYGSDGVADECLDLQERLKLDVNLLLFAAFVGAVEGVQLEKPDIAAANGIATCWHGEIVRALRRARRALKPASADTGNPLRAASAALRAQVKAAELDAEQIEQAMLWEWSQPRLTGRPRTSRDHALSANLRSVLEFYGDAASQMNAATVTPRLLDAATAYSRSIR